MKKERVSCKRGASGPAVRRDMYKNKTARSVWTRWLVSFVEKVGQSVRQVGRQAVLQLACRIDVILLRILGEQKRKRGEREA